MRLGLAENAGAFLGLGQGLPENARRAILVGGMAVILTVVLAWLLATRDLSPARSAAAGLVVGGGYANLLDRLPDGFVTDYVVLSAGPLRTGVFNLPDAAILAGVCAWLFLGVTRKASRDGPSCGA